MHNRDPEFTLLDELLRESINDSQFRDRLVSVSASSRRSRNRIQFGVRAAGIAAAFALLLWYSAGFQSEDNVPNMTVTEPKNYELAHTQQGLVQVVPTQSRKVEVVSTFDYPLRLEIISAQSLLALFEGQNPRLVTNEEGVTELILSN